MKYGQNISRNIVVVVVGLPQAGRYLRAPACLTTIRAARSHHMAWTRSSCIAKQDLPTLVVQFHELHLPNHHIPARPAVRHTTNSNIADRTPPTPAHSY
jgi:hypothetical protein